MRQIQKTSRGFTLLEMVLAMAITVVVVTALSESMYIAYHARDTAMAAVEQPKATELAGDIIFREMSVALPPTGQLAGPFEGVSDTVDFFISGPEPKDPIQGDIRHIEYALENDPTPGSKGQVLVRRVWTNLLAQVVPDPTEQVLAHGVTDWQIQYWDGTRWNPSWDSTTYSPNTLPLAVEVTLELQPLTQNGPVRHTTIMIPLACANLQTNVTGLNTGGFGQ